ncbi:MAG: cupredoxin domain-containing protein, partial [Acidimicrobiales bacterium]
MSTWRKSIGAVALLAVLALGACGGDSDSADNGTAPAGDQPAAAAGGDTVVIEGFKFSPTPLVVKAGTTINVENKDSALHTLTADDGSVDTGNLEQGDTGTIKISGTGEIAYHCNIHDYMKG